MAKSRGEPSSRDQRGQALTTFVAVAVLGLLAVCGLVVDGGARARTARLAELAAAQAARAAADDSARYRVVGAAADAASARAAASDVLAAYPGLTGEVLVRGTTVEVVTTAEVRTVLLCLIGIDSFRVSGSATAELIAGKRQENAEVVAASVLPTWRTAP